MGAVEWRGDWIEHSECQASALVAKRPRTASRPLINPKRFVECSTVLRLTSGVDAIGLS